METYFLELNAIINLGKRLNNYSELPNVKTSLWAIVEPLESVDENNYNSIRSTLLRIQTSKIKIDWDLPGDKEVKAFGHSVKTRVDEIIELYNAIIKEEKYVNLTQQYSEVITFVHDLRSTAKEIIINRCHEKRQTIDKMMTSLMLYVNKLTNSNLIETMSSYDNSLDRYVSAMNELINLKSKHTVNDFNDVYYFSYLNNPDTYLVSNDKQMKILDSKFNKVLTCDEFEKKMKIV